MARCVLPEPSCPTSARQPPCQAGQSSSAFNASRFVSEWINSVRAYEAGRLNFKLSCRANRPQPDERRETLNIVFLRRSVDVLPPSLSSADRRRAVTFDERRLVEAL